MYLPKCLCLIIAYLIYALIQCLHCICGCSVKTALQQAIIIQSSTGRDDRMYVKNYISCGRHCKALDVYQQAHSSKSFFFAAKAAPGSCFLGSTTLLNIAFGFGFSIFIAIYVAASFSGMLPPLSQQNHSDNLSECLSCSWHYTTSLMRQVMALQWQTPWGKANLPRVQLNSDNVQNLALDLPHPIIAGGHINPAVSLAFMLTQRISIVRGFLYIIFQCLGACTGSAFVYAVSSLSHRAISRLGNPHPLSFSIFSI